MMTKPTLITIGFPDEESPRYTNLVQYFTDKGYTVLPCHTSVQGFFHKLWDIHCKYKAQKKPVDTVLVTFPGHHLVPFVWIYTRFPRKKLIFDAFVSVSDTLVSDRKKFHWMHPYAWACYLLDVLSCHLADEVLLDTKAHKDFFMRRFFLSKKRIMVIPVGTRSDLFTKGSKEQLLKEHAFNILFIGSYIPLQGIEYIIEAAKILSSHPDIHFTLIGNGQTQSTIRHLVETYHLQNVTFIDTQPLWKLPHFLRSADLALGTFGTSDKARRIIAHKVYDAVSCGIPVITAENSAIGEQFTEKDGVYLCHEGSGKSLAETILNLRKKLW